MREIARERRTGERSPFNPGLIYMYHQDHIENLMQTHVFEASVEKCLLTSLSTHLKSCHFKLPLGGLAGCEGNINKTVRTSLDPPHPSGCWWRGIQKALSKSLFWINIGSSLVSETYRSFFTKHLFKYLYWKEQIFLQKMTVDLG